MRARIWNRRVWPPGRSFAYGRISRNRLASFAAGPGSSLNAAGGGALAALATGSLVVLPAGSLAALLKGSLGATALGCGVVAGCVGSSVNSRSTLSSDDG